MTKKRVIQLLQKKENIQLEFKEANNKLPSSLFETICAMLNRSGGDIILGADNNGKVTGIEQNKIDSFKTELVTLSNNPEQLKPPFILFPQSYEINGKWIIHIQVPASSQVHKKANTVYDRSDDGDFKINEPHRIAELYNQKRAYYTETKIYKYLKFEDFNQKLFPKIRNLIKSNNPNHPWLRLNYQQMLKTAGLWRADSQTGEEGYTLASALLFGKPEVILNIIPYYKIDALVRKVDTDRYDDREYIQVNLIEAYDKLMDFITKHLPDKFHLIRDQRVSLRNKIFREVIANLLIHREYLNAEPARLIIYSDRVETTNPNNPHQRGIISPDNFTPFSKNPLLAKFFTQLGWVDELGSGVLNVTKYLKAYSGREPEFIEDATFKVIIPLNGTVNYKSVGANEITVGEKILSDGANEQNDGEKILSDGALNKKIDSEILNVRKDLKQNIEKLLVSIIENEGKKVADYVQLTKFQKRAIERYIKVLRENNIIEFIGEPKAKNSGYFLTEDFRKRVKNE